MGSLRVPEDPGWDRVRLGPESDPAVPSCLLCSELGGLIGVLGEQPYHSSPDLLKVGIFSIHPDLADRSAVFVGVGYFNADLLAVDQIGEGSASTVARRPVCSSVRQSGGV
jgi:hypothetical protein